MGVNYTTTGEESPKIICAFIHLINVIFYGNMVYSGRAESPPTTTMEVFRMIYLAYGSNLDIPSMQYRCPTAKVLGTSILKGNRLVFSGVATVEHDEENSVPVLLWEIQPEDEKALDRYEGFPHLYKKGFDKVELNGKIVDVMYYFMPHGYKLSEPSQGYYEILKEAYETLGFDLAILEKARADSMV